MSNKSKGFAAEARYIRDKRGQFITGHVNIGGGKRVNLIDRFWSKIQKTDSCWIWLGVKRSTGYGSFNLGRKLYLAHRFSYMMLKGPILEGLTLDHLCKNIQCVNPDHLEPVPLKVNLLRGMGVGTINKNKTHCSKGHLLSDNNLVTRNDNFRSCRTCKNQLQRIRRARRY